MNVISTDEIQSAVGYLIISGSSLEGNQVFYQFDPVQSPYEGDTVYVNEGNINKRKLLKDLYFNEGVIQIVGWVSQNTNPALNLRTDLNDLIENKILLALASDPQLGSKARNSEVVSVITDAGAYASAGKAVAKIFFKVEYFSVV